MRSLRTKLNKHTSLNINKKLLLSLSFQTLRTCSIVTGFPTTGVSSILAPSFFFFLIPQFRFSLCLWKVQGKVLLKHIAKIYGGVELWLHAFLISTLNEGEWPVSGPGCFKAARAWNRSLFSSYRTGGQGGFQSRNGCSEEEETISNLPATQSRFVGGPTNSP